jgi:dipeptidyl aminopeptidase/acylaminoacyl peptidase
MIDAARGYEQRLTIDDTWETSPVWSRDGSRIAFNSRRTGRWELYQKASSGDGPSRLLLSSEHTVVPEDWASDGRILIQQAIPHQKGKFGLLMPDHETKPVPLLYLGSDEGSGRLSADGRWLAYRGYDSGWFIYVRPVGTMEGRWQVSSAVDHQAPLRWRRDGRELFYLAPDLSVMAVSVEPGATFRANPARRLFQTRAVAPSGVTGDAYDVASDGQRFLVKVPASYSPITVVVNWTSMLQNQR